MTVDRFFAERFAAVAGITWVDVYSGDRDAIEKAIAFGAPSGRFQLPDVSTQNLGVPGPHGVVPIRIYRSKEPGTYDCDPSWVAKVEGVPALVAAKLDENRISQQFATGG